MNTSYHMLSYIHESPSTLEKTLQVNLMTIEEIARRARAMKVKKVVWVPPSPTCRKTQNYLTQKLIKFIKFL